MSAPTLKHGAYRGLSKLCRFLGAGSGTGLRVLLYHSVGDPLQENDYGTAIAPELFAAHVGLLDRLRADFEPAPFDATRDGRRVAVTFDGGYRDVLTTAAPLLADKRIPMCLFATSAFIQAGGSLYLSPAELKRLAGLPGVSIGSHGATHRRLTELGDAELKEELSSSRKYLEDLMGKPVTALAYPHGAVDRRVRDAAEAAGYRLGGTSRYGFNGPGRDPLLLCRTEAVAWDTESDLELKVRGHWDWFRFRHPDPAAGT